jgi:ketosteroid isomerase-like protein
MSDATELADIQQQLARAWVARDRATIEKLIAPDWIVTGADGNLATRDVVLRDVFETGAHRIDLLEIDQVNVRPFGEMAVVTGRTHFRGEYQQAAYDARIRFTDVFARRDGQWQAVASHVSFIAEDSAGGDLR